MEQLHLEVLTPEKMALESEVSSVSVQGREGRLGILPRHTALISLLNFGVLEYEKDGARHKVLCGEGMVETVDNRITVLVRSAEVLDHIDITRAKGALERAKSRVHSRDKDLDSIRAEAALYRAVERLRFTKHL